MQQQGRKLFVPVHELFDVVFHLNTRVDDRPKMSGSDKREKREDILAAFAAEGLSQPFESTLRPYESVLTEVLDPVRAPELLAVREQIRSWRL